MEFKKTIRVELQDYYDYNFFVLKKLLIIMPIMIFLMAFYFMFRDSDVTSRRFGLEMTVSCVVSLVLAGLFMLLWIALLKRNLKKQYLSNRTIQSPGEFTLDDAGVHVFSEFVSNNIPWENVYQAAESQKAFYIYMAKMQAFVIPKRLLSPEDGYVIRELVIKYLPPAKCRLMK